MESYLEDLKERLLDHQISDALLEKLLLEYKRRIDEQDPTLREVPYEVELLIKKYDLKLLETDRDNMSKIFALYPSISIILYLLLGFVFDFWHPGWLIFIVVPIVLLVFSVFHDDILASLHALVPFMIILTYLLVGFYLDIWHPTWLVFLLMPVIGIFTTNRRKNLKYILFTLSPILSISLYLILGFSFNWWNRAWVVFLFVPIFACFQETKKTRLILCESSLIIAFVIGFALPFFTSSWGFSFFGLLVPCLTFIGLGEDSILKFTKAKSVDWMLVFSLMSIYLILGLFGDGWAYGWIIFLSIPVYEIIKQSTENFRFFTIMPFISIAIFFSLGYFFDLWAYSWAAFLLPVISFFIERD